jgi:hypothetical protein
MTEYLLYNINDAITLSINVSYMNDEHLTIWTKAFNTENNLRNNNTASTNHNKTVLHMSGLYICLGLWSISDIDHWWYTLSNESLRRMNIRHDRIIGAKYGESDEDIQLNIKKDILENRIIHSTTKRVIKPTKSYISSYTQTEEGETKVNINDSNILDYNNINNSVREDFTQSIIDILETCEYYVKNNE